MLPELELELELELEPELGPELFCSVVVDADADADADLTIEQWLLKKNPRQQDPPKLPTNKMVREETTSCMCPLGLILDLNIDLVIVLPNITNHAVVALTLTFFST